ncbi:hypothetical protein N0V90_006984 [Kalmusia sp. IMI 367209]|nr:hypothetical protein N0V90_006984 [Kalmusia sp. IMI 367209]
MSRLAKPSAQLDGLDVSHEQSPPPTLLPENINLRIHDCLLSPSEDLVGVYDIVHIQNFNSVIRENNPIPVIDNILRMLTTFAVSELTRSAEPGGYLTWGEYDFQSWKYNTITPTEEYNDELGKLLQYNATFGNTQEPNFQLHKYVFHTLKWLIYD